MSDSTPMKYFVATFELITKYGPSYLSNNGRIVSDVRQARLFHAPSVAIKYAALKLVKLTDDKDEWLIGMESVLISATPVWATITKENFHV